MKEYQSLSHTRWDCKYGVPGQGIFRIHGRLDEEIVRAYMQNQEHEDERFDQMKLRV